MRFLLKHLKQIQQILHRQKIHQKQMTYTPQHHRLQQMSCHYLIRHLQRRQQLQDIQQNMLAPE
jgi:hypothetical protein